MARDADRTTEYANTLRQADIFYDLTPQQLGRVARLCSEVTPKQGEIIFEENSPSDELYLVASGEIEILVNPALVQTDATEPSAGPMVITTIRRGQTFGEVALVDEGLRSASAGPSSSFVIKREITSSLPAFGFGVVVTCSAASAI